MCQELYQTSNSFLEWRVYQWIWKYLGMAFFFCNQAKMSTQFSFVPKILVLSPLSSIQGRQFAIFFVSPSPCFLTLTLLITSILSEPSMQWNEPFFSCEHLLKPSSLLSQESRRLHAACSRSLYDTAQIWNLLAVHLGSPWSGDRLESLDQRKT